VFRTHTKRGGKKEENEKATDLLKRRQIPLLRFCVFYLILFYIIGLHLLYSSLDINNS